MARSPAQQLAKLNRILANLEIREDIKATRAKIATKRLSLARGGASRKRKRK